MAAAGEFLLNRLDGRSPDEWLGACIPGIKESSDGCLEVGHAEENPALDRFVVEVTEPPLDQIHPAGTGGDEVRDKPGMAFRRVSTCLRHLEA